MKKSLLILAFVLSFGHLLAQKESVWNKVNRSEVSKYTKVRTDLKEETEQYFSLDVATFKQSLVNAKDKFSGKAGVVVEFPNRNGEIEKFNVWENSNMEPDFQAQFPQIRAYVGKGITDKGAVVNFSVSPRGIQTMLFRTDGPTEYIEAYDKEASAYVLFDTNSRTKSVLNCTTEDTPLNIEGTNSNLTNRSNNAVYKTMRLALSCNGEYAVAFGASINGTAADKVIVLAAMNATMTRVNGVYERDLAVHLNMVDNTNVIFYNKDTDPYSNLIDTNADGIPDSAPAAWNTQVQNTLSSRLTGVGTTLAANNAAYDIGHMFGASGGGGNAGCIGCVCVNDTASTSDKNKGSGITSPGSGLAQGDSFDIDFVAHEMGHQLGGNHTFSYGGSGNISQPEVSVVCVEPGSGSTIMAYAGVAYDENSGASYNVQNNSDPIMAWVSINQIQTNLASKTCPVSTPMSDNVPVVSAGADYTIPIGTAFVLTGTASDADANDVMTYLWEQNDLGTIDEISAGSFVYATKSVGPNFRTFKPSTNLFRYFPQMGKILGLNPIAIATGTANTWESVSTVDRALNFKFTARDNHLGGGQTATDNTLITVNSSGGAFSVTSQNTTGNIYSGNSNQTITWNAGNTASAPFNSPTVDILISTNVSTALETVTTSPNATSWTTIASGVPNNGSYVVTLPNVSTTKTACRFMVKAVGNVFLAVNAKNFTITPDLANEQFGLDNFSIFPNPNNGNFTVKFDSSTSNNILIGVHDIRGREVYSKLYQNNGFFNETLSLKGLQSGVYLVTVQDGNKKEVKKIIIE